MSHIPQLSVLAQSSLFPALQAFLSVFALTNLAGLSTGSSIPAVLFAFLFFCYKQQYRSGASRPARLMAGILGAFFALCYMAAEHGQLTGGFDNRWFQLFFLGMTALGLFVLFSQVCLLGFAALRRISFYETAPARPFSLRVKALLFFGLLLCWLPWFLYEFPAVMTPDSLSQFAQATGMRPYSDHHPMAHTLLIQALYSLAFSLTGNVYLSIGFYTLVQMCLLALIEVSALALMASLGLKKRWILLAFLLWALFPVHGVYAVTMWKDVLFAGFLLLYVLTLLRLLQRTKETARSNSAGASAVASAGASADRKLSLSRDGGLLLLLTVSGICVCLFRSNGLYVFLFTVPFLLFLFRRSLPLAGSAQLLILCAALLIKGPLYHSLDVEPPAFSESLSLPLQQVARVIANDRPLSEEQLEQLNRVADISYVPEYYNPTLSDPIKALVNYNHADILEANKGEYFRLWLQIGLAYPGDYIQAFIDQTKGYWFPAPADMLLNEGISPNDLGLSWQPVIRGMKLTKLVEIVLKLPSILPLYGMLTSIGAYTWGAVFLAGYGFLYGHRRRLLLFVPYAGLIGTLLIATPVASDFRYAYPLILALPVLAAAALEKREGVK